ncbi:hypothetical protein CROQUDRAFT_109056 [Cronartium quercuum f. sp. fusiforme G11]|uniref:Uncharacterized protein n=1 Tax=Cronartium quercuum f. sp. fusiforme G11 TaxID=708437 RepID=A0A9P6NCX7_9BASI|nr:hypothetical protein CROQUDRAFT_109056 [Cronartium quercuum f. sp. fusiforme G11]
MSVTDSEESLNTNGRSHDLISRIFAESQGARALPAHLKPYGPLWEPPCFVHPIYRDRIGWQIQRETFGVNPMMRSLIQTTEADLLYGPSMDIVSDLGWYKGKWNVDQKIENRRWGGWFDHHSINLNSDQISLARLDSTQVLPHLPKPIKLPPALTSTCSSDLSPIHINIIIIPSTAPSLQHIKNPGEVEKQGSLDCYAGPLKVEGIVNGKEQTTQKKFRFERFAASPLDQLLPDKPGYVFNAGGPVWSMDFLPGVDCYQALTNKCEVKPEKQTTKKVHLDYLALCTISEDPGLVPPSEMRKRGLTAKGSVQIWSVPPIEPVILGCPATPGRWSGDSVVNANPASELGHSKAEPNPRLRILLALPSQATVVRWCPRGGSKEDDNTTVSPITTSQPTETSCLGLLAIALADGLVGLYAPPDPTGVSCPDALSLNLKPCVELLLPDTTCLTLDWANHDVIAGGCTNGHIVIWHVLNVLNSIGSTSARSPTNNPFKPVQVRPTHYIPFHAAPVRSVIWIRTPPINQRGEPETDQDPTFLASTGYDGSMKLVDTEDIGGSATLIHERGETTSLAFAPTIGSLHLADSDYSIKAICLKPRDLGVSKKILIQLGLIWQLAASDFHSFIAYAAADGVCGLASMIRPQKYKSRATMWAPKVYQMDFNRNSGELRMLDNLRPDPRSNDGTAVLNEKVPVKGKSGKKVKKKGTDSDGPVRKLGKVKTEQRAQSGSPVGIWPGIVAIHCVSWCPSIRRASILASGMACGLVRVDSVGGGWHGKGMRYGGIDGLMNRVNDDVDDDDDQMIADKEEDDDDEEDEDDDEELGE